MVDADWAGINFGLRVVLWWRTYQLVSQEAELHSIVIDRGGICGTHLGPSGGDLAQELAPADGGTLSLIPCHFNQQQWCAFSGI